MKFHDLSSLLLLTRDCLKRGGKNHQNDLRNGTMKENRDGGDGSDVLRLPRT